MDLPVSGPSKKPHVQAAGQLWLGKHFPQQPYWNTLVAVDTIVEITTMIDFEFRTSPESKAFCGAIATEMTQLFIIDLEEAVKRINRQWKGQDLSEPDDWISMKTRSFGRKQYITDMILSGGCQTPSSGLFHCLDKPGR